MKIKQIPEDFYVEELISLKPKKEGDYAYFWLIKKNWTTIRAIQQIAKKCRVSKKRFRFAGTKDKVAVTKQAVSAFKIEPEILEKIRLKDIDIEIIGRGDKQISLGDLRGNKFEIVVRDLSKKDLDKIKKEIKKIKNGIKNYFGPQRFGRGNTHLIGKEIIKGNLEEAVKLILTFEGKEETKDAIMFRKFAGKNWGKWKLILSKAPNFLGIEKAVLNWLVKNPTDFAGALRKIPKPIRKMYVHAYQAWIFNKALEKLKIIRKKELPVPGTNTKLGRDKFSEEVKKILAREKIKLDDFKCVRMPELASKGNKRFAIIKPKKFKAEVPKEDELNKGKFKIKLKFELQKGAYATIVLGALFNGKT